MAAVIISGIPAGVRAQSLFLDEYPRHVGRLTSSTENVSCRGTLTSADYTGPVRFLRLGDRSLKDFAATRTTLAWSKRVESYTPEFVFRLDAAQNDDPYEWKGVTVLTALPSDDEERLVLAQRRWLRCDSFVCAAYLFWGKTVADTITQPNFNIVSERPAGAGDFYEVYFSISELDGQEFIQGRWIFEPGRAWALVSFDIVTRMLSHDMLQYYQGKITYVEWPSQAVVPATVSLNVGEPPSGVNAVVDSPAWTGGQWQYTAAFDQVETGNVTPEEFMPSAFGFPDYLAGAEERSNYRVYWILMVVVANLILFVWLWRQRRRQVVV